MALGKPLSRCLQVFIDCRKVENGSFNTFPFGQFTNRYEVHYSFSAI